MATQEWSGRRRLDEPLVVTYRVEFPLTESRRRKDGRPKAGVTPHHAVKPDNDNVSKLIQDGLTRAGILVDDGRFCDTVIQKRWTASRIGRVLIGIFKPEDVPWLE